MRLGVSGTHGVGKTTLAGVVAESLPGHEVVDEPYHDMVAQGHVFSHPPTAEDFEDQLEHALRVLSEDDVDVVFDRCPIDLLAYLLVVGKHADPVAAPWIDRIRTAMRSLDLVVFVPIESPDRIGVGEDDDGAPSRRAVDRELRRLLLHDAQDMELEVLQVRGSVEERASQVLRRLAGRARP